MPYNTIVEADAYFLARALFYPKWAPLTDPDKNNALLSSNQMLDQLCSWYGSKTDSEQENEFPRDGDTVAPDDVKTSELEIAYLMVDGVSTDPDAGFPVTSLKAGSVQLQFKVDAKAGNPLVNGLTKTLLNPLGSCDFNMGTGGTTTIPVYRG